MYNDSVFSGYIEKIEISLTEDKYYSYTHGERRLMIVLSDDRPARKS